jgi:hypothetical protein
MVKDPAAPHKWYKDYLGIDGKYGPMLKWSEEKGEAPFIVCSVISRKTVNIWSRAQVQPNCSKQPLNWMETMTK